MFLGSLFKPVKSITTDEVRKIIKKHMRQMEREIYENTGATASEFIRELAKLTEERAESMIFNDKYFYNQP